ncbi:MAG: transposase [Candidatus Brocadiales bacterium]|nr:transposase [Candidatus Brocadiales bacterium]
MNNGNDTLSEKREFIKGKIIIGIDPVQGKHQVRIIDSNGVPLGKTFSFRNDYNGFHFGLWRKLDRYLGQEVDYQTEVVFAVESACDLWQPLVYYLYTDSYLVVRVSPMTPGNFYSTQPIKYDRCPTTLKGRIAGRRKYERRKSGQCYNDLMGAPLKGL